MATPDFASAIRDRVLVFDGAMGTELYRRHVFTNRCFDELCVSSPELVREIHQAYAAAGADVLTTNSYGANRLALGRYGFGEQVAAINRAAAAVARAVADAAAGGRLLVAGSVGPVPATGTDAAGRVAMMAEQIGALAAGGADLILFETLPNREAAVEGCQAIQAAAAGRPFVLSFAAYDDDDRTIAETLGRLLAPLPAGLPAPAALGFNCGAGPERLLAVLERAVRLTALPLVVQPNAGQPRLVENRQLYLCSPEYLTSYARRYVELGARAVGGCCGTTPEHIREVARAIKPLARQRLEIKEITPPAEAPLKAPLPLAEKSRLGWKLANRQWVTTVELLPPRGHELAEVVAKAELCHRRGVDAVNIPDGPRAAPRLSPLVTALRLQERARIDTVLHVCCRDRNVISLQADLLACAACGVRNLLFITGDPPKLGNYSFASGVFDTDSIGLVGLQARLNRGVDLGGQVVEPATAAAIGVGADPGALDFDREVRRFRAKVAAGAEFAITQPVFAVAPLFRFLDAIADLEIPVIAGIWPLASLRNALFLKHEVPGVTVPDALISRMAAVATKEGQRQAGIEIAREAVVAVRGRVAGIQVSAPLGNVLTALAVAECPVVLAGADAPGRAWCGQA
ncbi:MAG: bifunctional homocysteine S-methyltransferase/methylenetetrahydrofolate reductase [Lentisphaeria bacterium]|jgi:homocysteine S-methyltransferase